MALDIIEISQPATIISEAMDSTAFIPAFLTTALYWTCWYPADQPCLPALILKVPILNKYPILAIDVQQTILKSR